MDSEHDNRTDNSVADLGNKTHIVITEEIEKKYRIYIDIFSKIPLTIGLGEVSVIDADVKKKRHTACGILCFSIEGYSYKDGFHKKTESIYHWAFDGSPRLRIIDPPWQDYQPHSYYSTNSEEIDDFIKYWSQSKDDFSLFGDEEKLSLHVYSDPKCERFLSIKLFSKKDYYTVAAWFILMEAYKKGRSQTESPVFEEYWPSCSHYYKPKKYEPKKEETIVFSDSSNDLLMREKISKLPFYRLSMTTLIGYYNDADEPCFFGDVNIVNIMYGDGVIWFSISNKELTEKMDSIREFTLAPVLNITKSKTESGSIDSVGGISLKTNDVVKKAETVSAPYLSMLPIVLECKLNNREGTYIAKYEASIFKTRISPTIIDDNGEINMSKAWSLMTCE